VGSDGQPAGVGQRLGDRKQLVCARRDRDGDGVDEGEASQLEVFVGGLEGSGPRGECVCNGARRRTRQGGQGDLTDRSG
jgi:hypothetical protein